MIWNQYRCLSINNWNQSTPWKLLRWIRDIGERLQLQFTLHYCWFFGVIMWWWVLCSPPRDWGTGGGFMRYEWNFCNCSPMAASFGRWSLLINPQSSRIEATIEWGTLWVQKGNRIQRRRSQCLQYRYRYRYRYRYPQPYHSRCRCWCRCWCWWQKMIGSKWMNGFNEV